MKTMREQNPLPKQPLVSRSKLDFRDGKGMAEMQGSIHVGERKIPKPLRKLFPYFCGRESSSFGL